MRNSIPSIRAVGPHGDPTYRKQRIKFYDLNNNLKGTGLTIKQFIEHFFPALTEKNKLILDRYNFFETYTEFRWKRYSEYIGPKF